MGVRIELSTNQTLISKYCNMTLLCTRIPYMISRLVDTRKAPRYTKYCLRFQYLSIKNPIGIFNAHGIPAQNPIEATKAAEKLASESAQQEAK